MDPLTVALISMIAGPVALIIGFLLFSWRRKDIQRWWLLLLGIPPATSFAWGLAFRVQPGSHPDVSAWVGFVPWLSFAAAVLLAIILPLSACRAYSRSAFALSVAALAGTVLASFGALMAVTGDYI